MAHLLVWIPSVLHAASSAKRGRNFAAARISRAYSSRLIDLKHTRCLFLAVIAFASAKRWLKAARGRFLPLLCLASAT